MAQRANPERIYEAKREGARRRLMGEGIPTAWVDAWFERWEAQHNGDRHASDYWLRAHDWIAVEYGSGHRPT